MTQPDNPPLNDRETHRHLGLPDLLQAPEAVSRLFDAIPAPAVITRASDGTVLAVNQALEEVTGYKPSQVLGRSVLALKWWPDPETRNRYLEELQQKGSIHNYPTQLPDAQGRLRDVLLAAHQVQLGGERCIVTIALDVTPILEAQRRLDAQEEQERLVLQEASDAIFLADEQGTLLEVNPAGSTLLGYEREEMLGKNFASFVPSDELERQPLILPRLQPGTEPQIVRRRLRRKDGSEVAVEINARRLSDGRIAGIFRDLTQRAALEAQIREAQKLEAIGRLAGGIAHDFNNLLTVIISTTQLLLESLEDETLKQDAQEILDAANRAATLTRQLLAFSRRQAIHPEILDPNQVLRNTEKLLRRVIGEEIELSPELNSGWHIYIDPGQLDQVIMNLVVNARDAMPRGGRLTLSTSDVSVSAAHPAHRSGVPEGDYVLITVRDTGVGMTPEILEHIFEPFFTTKPAGQGTGLGLATVYGIVAQNGGQIRVESEPGKGTAFYLYLPRAEAPTEQLHSPAKAEGWRDRPAGRGETIVIVEDDPGVRSTVRTVLRRAGYRVLEFGSPKEALDILKRETPEVDLLVSDVIMPGIRGPELHRQITQLYPNLPVLYLSGYPGDPTSGEPLLPPEAPVVGKPFHPGTLVKTVRPILEGRRNVPST
jgi:PAS domain S-box-containing protein